MSIALTVLSLLATVACFISPVWADCGYIILNVVRPNENIEGVLYPTIPLMIIAVGVSFLIHYGRKVPMPPNLRQPAMPLMIGMMALLAVHMLIWHMPDLVQWILDELAPVVLLALLAARFMATPGRLEAQFVALGAGSAFVSGQALFVHYLRKGPRVMKEGIWGEEPSHGALWDAFHLYGGTTDDETDHWRLKGRGDGVWGNSNDLGMACNWGVATAIYLARCKGRKLLRLIGLALLPMHLSTITLTQSRGSLLQFGITFWMVFIGGKRKAIGMVLLVIGLAGVLVVLPALEPERADAGESSAERKALAMEAVRLFTHSPVIGIGFNSFREKNSVKSLLPHNIYLQCMAETGLLGTGLMLAMIYFLRRDTSRALSHLLATRPKENITLLAQCIGALQFSFLIFLLFTNQFMRFTMALVLTLTFPLHRIVEAYKATSRAEEAGDASPDSVATELAPASLPLGLPARNEKQVSDAEVEPVHLAGPVGPRLLEPHDAGEAGSHRYVFDPSRPGSMRVVQEEDDEEEDDDER